MHSLSNFHMLSPTISDEWQTPLIIGLNQLPMENCMGTAMQKLQSLFTNLNAIEISEMLYDCDHNEDEVIQRLITHTYYLENIRYRIQQRTDAINSNSFSNDVLFEPIENTIKPISIPSNPNNHAEERPVDLTISAKKARAKQSAKKSDSVKELQPKSKSAENRDDSTTKSHKQVNAASDIKLDGADDRPKSTKKRSQSNEKRKGRLPLNEALQQIQNIDSEESFVGWSEARYRAYQKLYENPNEYYYRFNAPGEPQRVGAWDKQEQKLFLKRLAEHGANSQWGIFSTAIPGRVGYQCSNYYRHLIKTRQIHDPNYTIDEKGKVHYLFGKKNNKGEIEKTQHKHNRQKSVAASQHLKEKPQKKRTIHSDDEYCDTTYNPKKSLKKKKKTTLFSETEPLEPTKQHPSSDIETSAILGSVDGGRMTRRRYQELHQ
ncbi:hypothetical protein BD560DRAFT_142491 [Blakeslea trispora]|nr:hypothetical protein BD560DRAFT_142491 [Blakeslea trispora]